VSRGEPVDREPHVLRPTTRDDEDGVAVADHDEIVDADEDDHAGVG
jgi:hypothetical protein